MLAGTFSAKILQFTQEDGHMSDDILSSHMLPQSESGMSHELLVEIDYV